jgi:hypothetical protein
VNATSWRSHSGPWLLNLFYDRAALDLVRWLFPFKLSLDLTAEMLQNEGISQLGKGLKELSAHVFSKICPKPTFTFQAFIFVIYLPRVHTQGINWIWQQGKVSLAWLSESAIGECLRGLSDFNTFNHWLLPSWTGLKMKRKIPHWCKIVSGFELAPPTPLAPSSYPVSFSSTMMSPLWPPLPPSQSPVDLSHDRYLRYFIISSVGESSKEDLKMNEALLRCLCNGAYLEFT